MKIEEMKKLEKPVLQKEVDQLKKGFFNLKLSFSAGEVKDFSQFKKLRADIARCLTFLNQKNS